MVTFRGIHSHKEWMKPPLSYHGDEKIEARVNDGWGHEKVKQFETMAAHGPEEGDTVITRNLSLESSYTINSTTFSLPTPHAPPSKTNRRVWLAPFVMALSAFM